MSNAVLGHSASCKTIGVTSPLRSLRLDAAMLGIRVTIVRYISDEPQPGIVECRLEDAHGRQWSFVEKTAIVSAEHLDADTSYPQRGVIAAEMVGRSVDVTGRETIRVDTERPWHVESVDGVTQFDVLAETLVEL